MKLVTFAYRGAERLGALQDGDVLDIHAADPSLPVDMLTLIEGGARVLAAVRRVLPSATSVPLSEVKLRSPLARPGKIICVGQNYRDHCLEQNVPFPERPILFAKYNNTVIGPGDSIRLSPLTEQVDYEAELAFVVGRPASRVSESDALSYVFGYTCVNDVSARDIQFGDKQWTRGKSFDTFCPIGPAIVTSDEIPDPQSLAIGCTVSGEKLQDSNTSNMIFSCAFILSYISQSISLEPGDLISTGTPHGVGVFREPKRFLRDGDTVAVSVERIGELVNVVAAG